MKVQQGMCVPMFHYTWTWGGSRAVSTRTSFGGSPLLSEKPARDEGMSTSQRNIEYLKKNTSIYHSRAERTAYMSAIVNKDFVCSTTAA